MFCAEIFSNFVYDSDCDDKSRRYIMNGQRSNHSTLNCELSELASGPSLFYIRLVVWVHMQSNPSYRSNPITCLPLNSWQFTVPQPWNVIPGSALTLNYSYVGFHVLWIPCSKGGHLRRVQCTMNSMFAEFHFLWVPCMPGSMCDEFWRNGSGSGVEQKSAFWSCTTSVITEFVKLSSMKKVCPCRHFVETLVHRQMFIYRLRKIPDGKWFELFNIFFERNCSFNGQTFTHP